MNINSSKFGSFCSQFIDVVIDKNIPDPVSRFLLKSFVGLLKEEQETTDQKIDKLIASYYKTGISYLQDADLVSAERRQNLIEDALDEFRKAATLENALMAAKARAYVAFCYGLLGERNLALAWFEQAYQEGHNLERKLVEKCAASKMDVATIISLPLTTIYGAAWLGYRFVQKNRARQALGELHMFMQSLTNMLVAYQSRLNTLQTTEQREQTYKILMAQFADNRAPAAAPFPVPVGYRAMRQATPPPHFYGNGNAHVAGSPIRPSSTPRAAIGAPLPAHQPTRTPVAQPTVVMNEAPVHGYLHFNTGQPIRLNASRTTIGREIIQSEAHSSVDLALLPGSNTVSHKHAVIEVTYGTCTLTDLNSRNTTLVNGQRLSPNYPAVLHDGDILSFGSISCTFKV